MAHDDNQPHVPLVDALPFPAFAGDAHGTVVNRAWRRLIGDGDGDDDLQQRPVDGWLDDVIGSEREAVRERWRLARAGPDEIRVETGLLRHDGVIVPVQLRFSPLGGGSWLGVAADLRVARGALDIAEGRWRTVLDVMTEGLVLATTDGDVRYWNRAGLRMHGFSSLEEGRRTLPEFARVFALSTRDGVALTPDEWPMPRALRGETVRDLELVICKPGTDWKRVFSYNGGIVTADSGAPMVFITVTDLTDRVEALALANRREEQLRTAHEAAGIGTWEASFLEGTANMSAEFARILGLPADERGRARNMREFIVADDVPMMERAVAAGLDPDGDGRIACEVRATRVDGGTLWLRSSGRVTFEVDADGNRRPARVIGAVVDITDVRQAERRLATQNAVSTVLAEAATLSEATPKLIRAVCESEGWAFGGIWEIDRSKNVLRCAEMWHAPDAPLQEIASLTRTLSFARGDGLVGRVWGSGDAVLIEDIGDDPEFRRATAAKKAGLNSALAFPIAVGGEVIAVVDFLGQSITRTDGRLLEMFGVIGRQLGLFFERKRSEVERRTLETQLRQAQRIEAIGQLSGGIAHDFNNILAAIVGNAQLAMMDVPADHPAVESLEQIAQASARAKNLVQQILTFARQRPQQRQVIAAGAIVEESTRLLRAIIPATVELELTTSPDTPDILADATQVEQVIVNLGTNAWHALDGRPGKVTIDLRGVTVDDDNAKKLSGLKPGRYAVLSVSDTGRGMPADVLERIFEPFFTTRHQGKGTGLGLSVVHGIVQTHGGVIGVKSAQGSGTTFDIYLPDAGATARPEEPAAAPLSRGTGQHILFVDDEAPLVSLNKRLLQHLGYRVTACTAPSAALTTFLADPWSFSAVLTDMNMPEISGLQLATEILRTRPDVPVLLASGFITDELQAECLRLGIAEVLHKPVSIAQLSEALARALSTPDLPDLF